MSATATDDQLATDDRPAFDGGRPVDLDRLGEVVFTAVAALTVLVIGGAMLYYATQRPPWLDELATHYFIESPSEFLDRYRGDPHPAGYYLPIIGLGAISHSVSFLRIAALLFFTTAAVGLALFTTPDRRTLDRLLALVAPAACGTAVFVEWGADLRMYGSLGLCSAVLAVTVYHWLAASEATTRAVVGIGALIGLVACLHVWGTLIGVVYAAVVLIQLVRVPMAPATRSAAMFTALGVVGAVGLAYWFGPLQRNDLADLFVFNESLYVKWLTDGVSTNFGVVAFVAIVWLASVIVTESKLSLLAFDLPAAVVVFVAWAASQSVPIVKVYSVTPVVVITLTGLLVRLRARAAWLGALLLTVLLVSTVSTLDLVRQPRQQFEASTRYLASQLDPDDPCPVLVYPPFINLYHTRFFVGDDIDLVPLDDTGVANERVCDEGWFVANHLHPADIERLVDVDVRESWGTEAWVGRYRLK